MCSLTLLTCILLYVHLILPKSLHYLKEEKRLYIKLSVLGYRLTILKLLPPYIRVEQVSKQVVDKGSHISQC